LGAVSLAGVILQGRFYFYQFFPFLAFAAYLTANEVVQRFERFSQATQPERIWTIVCLAAVTYLAVDHWGSRMVAQTVSPHVLANMTLGQYQDEITKHQPRYPLYSTTNKAAQRVRELTEENDPIACLLVEPRVYYLAQRPPVFRLFVPQPVYRFLFDDFMEAIKKVRPKVVLARIPAEARESDDINVIEPAVFKDTEAVYGKQGDVIRKHYRVTEVIDDVCILQPAG
jgi:hypothetical protein